MILFSFLLPEASVVCGPVISLGALPDHMIHLNAARPMLSFSHSQKVLFSKSQSPPLAMKKSTKKTYTIQVNVMLNIHLKSDIQTPVYDCDQQSCLHLYDHSMCAMRAAPHPPPSLPSTLEK